MTPSTSTFTPTAPPSGPITIDYIYDPLNRLTEANYSINNSPTDYYHYSYDAVGNRKTQQSMVGGLSSVSSYNYDHANRLTDVNGVLHTWDDNGNLLSDGVNVYTYDFANRLKSITQGANTANFGYNGLGDRLTQNGVPYTLDLNAGLTQVLSDGTNTYVYGLRRIAEQQGSVNEFYLGDALGSVRQITNDGSMVTLGRNYDPFGKTKQSIGTAQTNFGYTGEYTDPSGLIYLRARYYQSDRGRFFQKDPSGLEQNTYQYAAANPVTFSDPSGLLFWAFRSGSRAELLGNPSTYNRNNNFAHPWIEYWVEQHNGFWNTHAEFPGKDLKKIDLIVFDRVNSPGFNSSPVDFGVPVIGSVFEIEPANPNDIIKGYAEIQLKEAMISSGAPPFVHSGVLPLQDRWPMPVRSLAPYAGMPYNWSTVIWQFGDSLSSSHGIGPVRVDPNEFGISGISGIPNAYWAMVIVPGLILYVDEQTLQRASGAGATITTAYAAKYIYDQYKKAQDRPNGGSLPNPQPGPAYSQLQLQSVDPTELFELDSTCIPGQLNPWLIPLPIP